MDSSYTFALEYLCGYVAAYEIMYHNRSAQHRFVDGDSGDLHLKLLMHRQQRERPQSESPSFTARQPHRYHRNGGLEYGGS